MLALGATVLGAAVLAGVDVSRDVDRVPPDMGDACRALVAYRDAGDAQEWRASREALGGVVRQLRGPQEREARAVRAYAHALLGPPDSGSGQLLMAAARACRQAGAPELYRKLRPLLPRLARETA